MPWHSYRGYQDFDPTISFAGVIFNRVGSQRHRQMIEGKISLPSFGWIPKREDIVIESRHLGLKMAHETGPMEKFGCLIEEFCRSGCNFGIRTGSSWSETAKKELPPR